MPNFYEYNPEQAYLLPPSVREVLGEKHLCFFVHRVVEKLDLKEFEEAYSEEGHPAYHPALLLKVWLYAYALGMTSSRRLEERIREDLAFRYLAGGAQPDYWALNDFRRRHRRAMNDVFTQVVELARSWGWESWDTWRSTRRGSRRTRRRIRRRRSRSCGGSERRFAGGYGAGSGSARGKTPNEGAGMELAREELGKLEERLGEIPGRIERLKKSGMKKLSRTDADSRFLRERKGFTLGYTATVAVSEDHLIVAQQVSQAATDNELLVPMVDEVERQCGEAPAEVSGDSGIFLEREFAGDGGAEDRSVRAGRESGAGVESRGEIGTARLRSGASAHAQEIALPGGTASVSAAKRNRRAGLGSVERAARDAAVPDARAGESGDRVHLGGHGVEPDAAVASEPAHAASRLGQPNPVTAAAHFRGTQDMPENRRP